MDADAWAWPAEIRDRAIIREAARIAEEARIAEAEARALERQRQREAVAEKKWQSLLMQSPPVEDGPIPDELDSIPTSNEVVNSTISSSLPFHELIAILNRHGCMDLTTDLSLFTLSEYPVSTGGFGDVYSATVGNQVKVAVKFIRPLEVDTRSQGKYHKRAAKELYTWSKCQHPNVARLIGVAGLRGRLAMISAWAENGTLPVFLERNKSADRCSLSTSICEGLAYLHKNNIVHGDLKGANILVSAEGTPMLMDFGSASLTGCTIEFTTTTTDAGFSPRWTAPERLNGSTQAGYSNDVYALGMTILETITGNVPFNEIREPMAVFVAIALHSRIPSRPEEHIPTQSEDGDLLWNLLLSCWSREPQLRPSAANVRDSMKSITQEKLFRIDEETTAIPEPSSRVI